MEKLPIGSRWEEWLAKNGEYRDEDLHDSGNGSSPEDFVVDVPGSTTVQPINKALIRQYHHVPEVDKFRVVKCLFCQKMIKLQIFAQHCVKRHGVPLFALEPPTSIKMEPFLEAIPPSSSVIHPGPSLSPDSDKSLEVNLQSVAINNDHSPLSYPLNSSSDNEDVKNEQVFDGAKCNGSIYEGETSNAFVGERELELCPAAEDINRNNFFKVEPETSSSAVSQIPIASGSSSTCLPEIKNEMINSEIKNENDSNMFDNSDDFLSQLDLDEMSLPEDLQCLSPGTDFHAFFDSEELLKQEPSDVAVGPPEKSEILERMLLAPISSPKVSLPPPPSLPSGAASSAERPVPEGPPPSAALGPAPAAAAPSSAVSPTKARRSRSRAQYFDPDKHCGVWDNKRGEPFQCLRSITCKAHSLSARRAIAGRSKPLGELLQVLKEEKQAKKDEKLRQSGIEPETSQNIQPVPINNTRNPIQKELGTSIQPLAPCRVGVFGARKIGNHVTFRKSAYSLRSIFMQLVGKSKDVFDTNSKQSASSVRSTSQADKSDSNAGMSSSKTGATKSGNKTNSAVKPKNTKAKTPKAPQMNNISKPILPTTAPALAKSLSEPASHSIGATYNENEPRFDNQATDITSLICDIEDHNAVANGPNNPRLGLTTEPPKEQNSQVYGNSFESPMNISTDNNHVSQTNMVHQEYPFCAEPLSTPDSARSFEHPPYTPQPVIGSPCMQSPLSQQQPQPSPFLPPSSFAPPQTPPTHLLSSPASGSLHRKRKGTSTGQLSPIAAKAAPQSLPISQTYNSMNKITSPMTLPSPEAAAAAAGWHQMRSGNMHPLPSPAGNMAATPSPHSADALHGSPTRNPFNYPIQQQHSPSKLPSNQNLHSPQTMGQQQQQQPTTPINDMNSGNHAAYQSPQGHKPQMSPVNGYIHKQPLPPQPQPHPHQHGVGSMNASGHQPVPAPAPQYAQVSQPGVMGPHEMMPTTPVHSRPPPEYMASHPHKTQAMMTNPGGSGGAAMYAHSQQQQPPPQQQHVVQTMRQGLPSGYHPAGMPHRGVAPVMRAGAGAVMVQRYPVVQPGHPVSTSYHSMYPRPAAGYHPRMGPGPLPGQAMMRAMPNAHGSSQVVYQTLPQKNAIRIFTPRGGQPQPTTMSMMHPMQHQQPANNYMQVSPNQPTHISPRGAVAANGYYMSSQRQPGMGAVYPQQQQQRVVYYNNAPVQAQAQPHTQTQMVRTMPQVGMPSAPAAAAAQEQVSPYRQHPTVAAAAPVASAPLSSSMPLNPTHHTLPSPGASINNIHHMNQENLAMKSSCVPQQPAQLQLPGAGPGQMQPTSALHSLSTTSEQPFLIE